MTPETLAALERILIVFAAGFFAYLGFQLYVLGLSKGPSKFHAKGPWGEFVMSGARPGILFMAFGGVVLVYSLATSGIRSKVVEQVEAASAAASEAKLTPVPSIRTHDFASSAAAGPR